MSLTTTLTLGIASFVLTVVFGWLGARPSRPGRVRLAPWRFMMLLTFTAMIATAVHLASFLGGVFSHEAIAANSPA